MNDKLRAGLVAILTFGLAALAFVALSRRNEPNEPTSADSTAVERHLPGLDSAQGWLNAPPPGADFLAGHVVVLALWSDTDPRSMRALPDIEAWHRAYSRYGVRVIAVHSPEFAFSADSAHAARLPERFGLSLPIALDASLQITNQIGPMPGLPHYLVADPGGRVVLEAGCGEEGAVDGMIRQQLTSEDPSLDLPRGPGRSDVVTAPSPRVVRLGANQAREGPLANVVPGQPQMFTTQFRFQEEGAAFIPYPVGKWTPHADGLTAARGGPSNFVAIRSTGGTASAVLGPATNTPSKVWILEGSAWLGRKDAGADVRFDERGAAFLVVAEPRLYEITSAPKPHMLRLSPEDPGVTFHSFVFEGVK